MKYSRTPPKIKSDKPNLILNKNIIDKEITSDIDSTRNMSEKNTCKYFSRKSLKNEKENNRYNNIKDSNNDLTTEKTYIVPSSYFKCSMNSLHCSISHFGVLVAPQIPMVLMSVSHEASISSGPSIRWVLGFTRLHSLYSTLPLELLRPQTNSTKSCFVANCEMLGIRLATERQMVSKLLKVAPGAMCDWI